MSDIYGEQEEDELWYEQPEDDDHWYEQPIDDDELQCDEPECGDDEHSVEGAEQEKCRRSEYDDECPPEEDEASEPASEQYESNDSENAESVHNVEDVEDDDEPYNSEAGESYHQPSDSDYYDDNERETDEDDHSENDEHQSEGEHEVVIGLAIGNASSNARFTLVPLEDTEGEAPVDTKASPTPTPKDSPTKATAPRIRTPRQRSTPIHVGQPVLSDQGEGKVIGTAKRRIFISINGDKGRWIPRTRLIGILQLVETPTPTAVPTPTPEPTTPIPTIKDSVQHASAHLPPSITVQQRPISGLAPPLTTTALRTSTERIAPAITPHRNWWD